jgi:NADH:ubiquinone oxidoreductase subunit 2 (subunit N)
MKKLAFLSAFLLTPTVVFAQATTIRNLYDVGNFIIGFINTVLVPLVLAIAFIVFIWGIFTYFIQGGDNDEKREQGQKLMLYGIVGFFVMVSVWGLVNILVGTFNFGSNSIRNLPSSPGIRN